jgi:hypothetical protein
LNSSRKLEVRFFSISGECQELNFASLDIKLKFVGLGLHFEIKRWVGITKRFAKLL